MGSNAYTIYIDFLNNLFHGSRVAQWKRAGPITQRSEDRNLALLEFFILEFQTEYKIKMDCYV